MNTELSPKTGSRNLAREISLNIAEILLLMGIGMLGVLLHAKFRIPLRLPGHHGIIYMALLVSGRILSKKPYASSLSSIGASMMLLFPLGFKDPFMPLIYLLPGILMDVTTVFGRQRNRNIFIMAIFCGLAYMTIPLSRILITTFTGFPYGSFISGFLYPSLTHFLFGAAGGLAGAGLMKAVRKKS